uniref:Uncharacterized protein n=1 Tax=Cacopsylla melanoneura TaxID=428564 RepID=A0A8D9EBT8_9HEMI
MCSGELFLLSSFFYFFILTLLLETPRTFRYFPIYFDIFLSDIFLYTVFIGIFKGLVIFFFFFTQFWTTDRGYFDLLRRVFKVLPDNYVKQIVFHNIFYTVEPGINYS